MTKVAIVGTMGVPGRYGGFETLAENLCRYHEQRRATIDLNVYCSSRGGQLRPNRFCGARLHYLPLQANGLSSVPYDVLGMLLAIARGADSILLLGVSGGIFVPLLRVFSSTRVVVNVDGIEWRREKWGPAARRFLQTSEAIAARFADVVIADNRAVAEHIESTYGRRCEVVAYGGDHVFAEAARAPDQLVLPDKFVLALSRIEPENNVEPILRAFAGGGGMALVYIGNWEASAFGRALRKKFASFTNIFMMDPIYDVGTLRFVRERALVYVHGHSAGGTNPSLVEIMHFGCPVVAFDCAFNRFTTDDQAFYFSDSESLRCLIAATDWHLARQSVGVRMKQLADERYKWDVVGARYFDLLV